MTALLSTSTQEPQNQVLPFLRVLGKAEERKNLFFLGLRGQERLVQTVAQHAQHLSKRGHLSRFVPTHWQTHRRQLAVVTQVPDLHQPHQKKAKPGHPVHRFPRPHLAFFYPHQLLRLPKGDLCTPTTDKIFQDHVQRAYSVRRYEVNRFFFCFERQDKTKRSRCAPAAFLQVPSNSITSRVLTFPR